MPATRPAQAPHGMESAAENASPAPKSIPRAHARAERGRARRTRPGAQNAAGRAEGPDAAASDPSRTYQLIRV
ncbi:hypothetical protein ACTU6U_01475 [Microbacterium sp. A196]